MKLFAYDAGNRLTGQVDWAGGSTSYTYDDLGRLVTTTLPNGVVSSNSYDGAGL
jgi:YD repeat-containing protein